MEDRIARSGTLDVLDVHTRQLYCYACAAPCSLDELERVDRYFEEADIDEFTHLIDALGLHHCSGSENLFHYGLANTCSKCLRRALDSFLAPLFLPIMRIKGQRLR